VAFVYTDGLRAQTVVISECREQAMLDESPPLSLQACGARPVLPEGYAAVAVALGQAFLFIWEVPVLVEAFIQDGAGLPEVSVDAQGLSPLDSPEPGLLLCWWMAHHVCKWRGGPRALLAAAVLCHAVASPRFLRCLACEQTSGIGGIMSLSLQASRGAAKRAADFQLTPWHKGVKKTASDQVSDAESGAEEDVVSPLTQELTPAPKEPSPPPGTAITVDIQGKTAGKGTLCWDFITTQVAKYVVKSGECGVVGWGGTLKVECGRQGGTLKVECGGWWHSEG